MACIKNSSCLGRRRFEDMLKMSCEVSPRRILEDVFEDEKLLR